MSKGLRRHLGQLIVAGFRGATIPSELRALAREFDLGGVILFDRNVDAPGQVAELAYDARALSREMPAWVSVDQEGGRVARLRAPFTEWPPMMTLGRSRDRALAERFGRALAAELRAVGVTLDYAPVLDVDTNSDNPVIGDRALSDRADDVAQFGAAIVDALQEQGIAACGKHFPGHGDTTMDSHDDLPVVVQPPERLREVEFEPFRAAIASRVAAIMTAHVVYPALDADRPATLSPAIVGRVLRDELGFEGIVATDDLEMGAIARHHTLEDATVRSIGAGCDMVLLCGPDTARQVAAIEALIHAIEDETLSERRVADALARQRRVKERFFVSSQDWRPPADRVLRALLGCAEHQAVAAEMEKYAS